jgi:hypothetical protein
MEENNHKTLRGRGDSFVVLGFELRDLHWLAKVLYHLNQTYSPKIFKSTFFFFFWQNWELNSGPHAC